MNVLYGVTSKAAALLEEPCQSPEVLCPIDALSGLWWVVHTRSRCEKALAEDLGRRGIGYFLPLTHQRRRHGRRMADVDLPLFPGYLFLCGGDDERYATLMTHRAAGIIPVADQDRLKNELRQIHRVLLSNNDVDLYPALRKGRRCRVTRGPLTGLEGVVLRRRDVYRIYIGVEVLGQSAEIQIDPSLLEPIE